MLQHYLNKPQHKKFRQDLYFRLAQYTVTLPPLRQRREDIPLLARHFLHLLAVEMNREPPKLGEAALASLLAYDFPGNVRELKNLVERALIKSRGEEILPEHLDLGRSATGASEGTVGAVPALRQDLPLDLERALELAEEDVVSRALAQSDGNLSAAARLLGTNRPRIYRALGRLKSRPVS